MGIILFLISFAYADYNSTLCDRSKYQVDVDITDGEFYPKFIYGVEKEYVCLTIRSNENVAFRIDGQPVALSIRSKRIERIAFKPQTSGEFGVKLNGLHTTNKFIVKSLKESDDLKKRREEERQLYGHKYKPNRP